MGRGGRGRKSPAHATLSACRATVARGNAPTNPHTGGLGPCRLPSLHLELDGATDVDAGQQDFEEECAETDEQGQGAFDIELGEGRADAQHLPQH
eukprot:scaffold5173_cov125-Isochrysis_galbana.AAC.9